MRAFDFRQGEVTPGPDGSMAHVELWYGSGAVMLGARGDGSSADGVTSFPAIDEHHRRAKAAGAEIVRELHDTDYGSGDYAARDPEGRLWFFGTHQASHSS